MLIVAFSMCKSEMAPSVSVNFISLVSACVRLRREEPQTSPKQPTPCPLHGRLIEPLACSRGVKLYLINQSISMCTDLLCMLGGVTAAAVGAERGGRDVQIWLNLVHRPACHLVVLEITVCLQHEDCDRQGDKKHRQQRVHLK